MNLVIIAVLSLVFVLGWYKWSMSKVRLMQTWRDGSDLIALSPDGKLLATPAGPSLERKIGILPVTAGTTVKLHAFPDGEVIRTLGGFYVTSLAFSPDNSLIAVGTGLGEILIWRTDDGQLLHSLRATMSKPGRSGVHSLIFSRDGQTLVTAVGGQIDVWRVVDGQLRYSLSHEYNCYDDISPDGQILALSSGGGHRITLYRLRDGTLIRELESYGHPKFNPDGKILVIYLSIGYEQNPLQKILLYRIEDNTFLGRLFVFFEGSVSDYAFSPDGRYLAATYQTGGGGPGIMLGPDLSFPKRWHLVLWRLDNLSSEYFIPRTIQSRKKIFTALAFSPDGKILVSGGDAIRLWRMPD